MKMPEIDYQQIVNAVAEMIKCAVPIGLILGLTEKLCNLFFSLAFGKKKIDL